MSQDDFGTIDPNTKSGTQLATDLNDWRDTVHSSHLGSSEPSYVVGGMVWADSTTSDYSFKAYDGTDSIPVFQLDATNNVARVAIDADGDSYIVAPSDDKIDVVLTGSNFAAFSASGFHAVHDGSGSATPAQTTSTYGLTAAADGHMEVNANNAANRIGRAQSTGNVSILVLHRNSTTQLAIQGDGTDASIVPLQGDLILANTDQITKVYRQNSTAGAAALQVRTDLTGADTLQFQVAVDGDVTNTNNSYGAISSRSYKRNVTDPDAEALLDQVKGLKFREYDLYPEAAVAVREKRDPEAAMDAAGGADGRKAIGLIAEEIEGSAFGDLVKVDADGVKTVNYMGALVRVAAAVPSLIAKVDALEAQNENLRKAVGDLRAPR